MDEPAAAPAPLYLDLLKRLDSVRRIGVSLGLERVHEALRVLGDPQRASRCVQIAGTNGKGSTAAMTAAILREAGLRTGLYTSPHLARFTERIVIDGREVDGDDLARFDLRIQATGVALTYFEVATVLAFLAFQAGGVEVSVLETGLGGRLDATTACAPTATAITGIALDHTDILGTSLTEIAREKAGIAKPGIPLFVGPVGPEAEVEIARVAAQVGAPVFHFGRDFHARPEPSTPGRGARGLRGAHQQANAAIAVALAEVIVAGSTPLRGRDVAAAAAAPARPSVRRVALSDVVVDRALATVAWPGRLEAIAPDVLLDCAHNADGAMALARYLDDEDHAAGTARWRALVLSVVEGKAAGAICALLAPRFELVYLTRSSSERALAPEALAALVPEALRGRVRIAADPMAALASARAALRTATAQIVVTGSIFLVGDVRSALLGERRDPIPTSDPLPRAPGV